MLEIHCIEYWQYSICNKKCGLYVENAGFSNTRNDEKAKAPKSERKQCFYICFTSTPSPPQKKPNKTNINVVRHILEKKQKQVVDYFWGFQSYSNSRLAHWLDSHQTLGRNVCKTYVKLIFNNSRCAQAECKGKKKNRSAHTLCVDFY